MKKKWCIYFIAILINHRLICNDNKIELKLNISIPDVIEILGEPKNISTEDFSYNHDFDMICYEYETCKIFSFRVSQAISKIQSVSNQILLNIDNKKISCGISKAEIDSLFKEGILDGKDSYGNRYYYYSLTKLREFDVLYNESNIAVEIIYGYSTP